MIKYFLTIFLLKNILWGCSLCSIYTPKTHVSTQIKADKTHIKTLNISWSFANEFTKELIQIYDTNLDKTFDEKELKFIENALLDYLKAKNFITFISYDKQINQQSNSFEVRNYKMNFKNSVLSFDYSIDLNYKIYDKNILYIKIIDDENYFDIVFNDKKQLMNIPYKISKISNINEVSFTIDAPDLNFQEEKIQELSSSKFEEKKQIEEIKQETILEKFTLNVKKYLVDIQNNKDKFSFVLLMMASFLYGIIHSIGPGHGKALAFSYFSSQKSSYFEAFIISLAMAFIHILGALVIVLISVVVLQSVMNRFLEDSISYITTFSAIVIMFLALYILYKKFKKKPCSCCINLKKANFSTISQNMNFVKQASNKPIIEQKRDKKQDLIFVITAGIIPCPGTVLLFVYAFLLKTYLAVIFASISISLGMAVVIFASSFLGVSLNKSFQKSKNVIGILEIISPIFMLGLACLLLLSSLK